MMIDLEDKMPAPPMSIPERVLLGITVPIGVYCFLAPFITLGRHLFR